MEPLYQPQKEKRALRKAGRLQTFVSQIEHETIKTASLALIQHYALGLC